MAAADWIDNILVDKISTTHLRLSHRVLDGYTTRQPVGSIEYLVNSTNWSILKLCNKTSIYLFISYLFHRRNTSHTCLFLLFIYLTAERRAYLFVYPAVHKFLS